MKIRFPDNIKNLRKDTVKKIVVIAAIVVFACIWVFYECSHKEDVNDAITNVEIVNKEVKQVELYMYPVKTLNPLVSADENLSYINKLMYSSLFDFDNKLTPVGDLVENYSFSGDTVTVKLKNGKWQDGEKIDADDVKFTVKAIKSIGEEGPYYEKADKIKSVEGNDNSVEIRFKDENDLSLAYLSFPIVAEHKYKSVSAFKKDEDFAPFGSGMYKCTSYEAGKSMMLESNEGYYGNKPKSKVRVNIIKKDSSLSKLVETSNITVLYDKSLMRKTLITKKNIKIDDIVGNQVEFIAFNNKNEFLANKKIRQAICHSIDSDKLIEECYYGNAKKSDSLYFPEYLGAKAEEFYDFDVEEAVDILKEENLSDKNDDGILDNKNKVKFTVSILVNADNAERVSVAERVAESLKNIDIDAKVDKKNTEAYMSALNKGSFDIYIGGMRTDETMDFRKLLKTGAENNYTGYSNEKLDRLLDEFMSGKSTEESVSILSEIKKILKEDANFYCIGYRTYGIVESPVFEGEVKGTFTHPYKGIETWSCIYEKRKDEKEEVETPPSENGN